MAEILLRTENLTKHFGGIVASDSIDLEILRGELHAVIGPNGAGKTTLIGQLTGVVLPDAGRVIFAGEDITAMPVSRRSLTVLISVVSRDSDRIIGRFEAAIPAASEGRWKNPGPPRSACRPSAC